MDEYKENIFWFPMAYSVGDWDAGPFLRFPSGFPLPLGERQDP